MKYFSKTKLFENEIFLFGEKFANFQIDSKEKASNLNNLILKKLNENKFIFEDIFLNYNSEYLELDINLEENGLKELNKIEIELRVNFEFKFYDEVKLKIFNLNDKIIEIKKKLYEQFKIEINEQRLFFNEIELENGKNLMKYFKVYF